MAVLRQCELLALLALLAVFTAGCGLRTVPPVRYMPLLGKEKQVTTTQVLVRALKDRDTAVRAQAIELLGVLALADDKGVKQEAARVLGAALKDRDPGIRLQVVEKLGAVEARYGNKYLLSALKDPNPYVRERVLQVLTQRERATQTETATEAPAPQAALAP